LILASTNEVWGLVVNEALASGLHVVVSNKCGAADFVKDMKGAYICSTDHVSIQEAMKKSSNAWNGYIQEPEILKFTPEKFAEGVLEVANHIFNPASSLDLVWFTNIPTPYRISTWRALDSRIRLKLLFLNNSERGGDWELVSSLQGLNYRSFQEKAIYPSSSIPLYINFIKPVRRLRKINGKAIYIDGWESPAFFVTALYAKKIGMQVFFGYRGTADSHRFNNVFIRKIRSAIFSKADLIVTAGTASTKAVEAMGIAPEKIITLFNPVDVGWFHSFAKDHRTPQSQGHRYIYVGQLIERKNVASVIQAFAAVKNEDDTLTIVGDGPLASELKRLSNSLGIEHLVHFVGHKSQEELAALYAASNTFILASTNEVWGLVVNEALASGLHVVVSNKCGAADFVKDMKGAYTCATDQVSIQEAMKSSSNSWSGYIQNPEILQFTPEKFADDLISYSHLGI
jgi:glycosyltransferase involved in cell wall biosynthesis